MRKPTLTKQHRQKTIIAMTKYSIQRKQLFFSLTYLIIIIITIIKQNTKIQVYLMQWLQILYIQVYTIFTFFFVFLFYILQKKSLITIKNTICPYNNATHSIAQRCVYATYRIAYAHPATYKYINIYIYISYKYNETMLSMWRNCQVMMMFGSSVAIVQIPICTYFHFIHLFLLHKKEINDHRTAHCNKNKINKNCMLKIHVCMHYISIMW